MEYLVTMTTHVPDGTSPEAVEEIRTREAARSGQLATEGHLLRLWRPPPQPGEWRTLGLFAAEDGDQLEQVLASMPLRGGAQMRSRRCLPTPMTRQRLGVEPISLRGKPARAPLPTSRRSPSRPLSALVPARQVPRPDRLTGWPPEVAFLGLTWPPTNHIPKREVTTVNDEQFAKIKSGRGFIAALDQSGGSTPKALALYGIPESAYSTDKEMFDLMHEMRSRIMLSPSFNGDRILGAILFEDTMDRDVAGKATADYLWDVKRVVPFLKVDKGLEPEANGVQVMKPIAGLGALLARARTASIFGTKMRSVIKLEDEVGIKAIAAQQFDIARQILAAGLVPIIEPEVDIHSPSKAEAESRLKAAITEELAGLSTGQHVILKLTLPDEDDFYAQFVSDPRVLRVLALSGGYNREQADERLARNHGVIASFSRALTEGLSAQQTSEEFDATLDEAIASIFRASAT